MSTGWLFLQLIVILVIDATSEFHRGVNTCMDLADDNYRCGSTAISLTGCRLADLDLADIATCFDATIGGRKSITQVFFLGNDVTSLAETLFRDMDSLKLLIINDNKQLTTLPEGIFAGLESLEVLSINDNPELMTIPETLFAGLSSLKTLVVSFNDPAEPSRTGMFSGLEKLQSLTIARKELTTLHQGVFSGLDTLSALKLTLAGDKRNNIHQIETDMPSQGERNAGQHARDPTEQHKHPPAGEISIADGRGTTLLALGEPKSGTTWTGNIVTELAVQLCGHSANEWCQLSHLRVSKNDPGSWYDFEMVHADTKLPLLNFQGKCKHVIPGLEIMEDGCNRWGETHRDSFETAPPCTTGESPTRERLLACLPNTSPPCNQHLLLLDPAVLRTVVAVRDPRNVVISEHRMRKNVYWEMVPDLDTFIHRRFETIVAWMHQRWVWHTTTLKASSHIMFFEDFEVDHLSLVHLAKFIGLECPPEQALDIWNSTRNASPHGLYTEYGLPSETIEWMNATMSALLPVPMLSRWGLTATDL